MADDNKAVGPLAMAKLVALIKAETAKKYDKTGGKIEGSAEITGDLQVAGYTECGVLEAQTYVKGGAMVMSPVIMLDDAATDVYLSTAGDGAVKMTITGADADAPLARLKVATPTGDNDATTKAYVDAKASETVYVDFWGTGQSEVYDKALKAYTIALSSNQTYDAVFDLISSGANVIARLYEDSSKTELVAESIEAQISGDKTLGNISFLFLRAASGIFAGFPTIADAIWVTKTASGAAAYALYKYCALPIPAGDSTDSGKVPTINGKKWEMKKAVVDVDDALSDTSTNPVQNKVVKAALDEKAGTATATQATAGLMSATDKKKLVGIEDGANKTIVDTALDTGSTNPVQNKVVKTALDGKASTAVASTSANGLMSAEDKAKLDAIDENYSLPEPIPNGSAVQALVVDKAARTYKLMLFDKLELPGAAESTNAPQTSSVKYALDRKASKDPATTEANGLMSASDKSKLDDIEYGANKTVVDAALDASSTNSVQNKAVKAALDKKADKAALDNKADTTVATASANGLMSAADKKKLDSMYDIVATSTDGETFDITPAQLHEKLKGVPTACAIKVVDTIIPLHRVQLPGDGSTKYIFQTTKDNGFWEPNTRLAYTASAGGTYAGTIWGKSEYDLLASTPGILKFTGAAEAQFSGSKDVTIDIPTGEGAVRYDETQKLTSDQKFRASQNIGAVSQKHAFIDGVVMLQAIGHDDGASVVNITPSEKSNDYTLTLDGGPENVPVYVAGLETPTDAQTDYATNVAYVKAKIAEVAASGGVDVDNALSATSTNPVQNKVITSALTKKAGTAVATTSANGLMSKADKTKLDDIERGANKTTIDSAMSGSSVNPVQNKVIKQYIDDKVAAAGSNITVDAELSATSTNPVQNKAVKAAIDAKADKTALDGKLDKAGGTLTGNLTGKYITGTWLRSTEASDLGRTPGKIAVLDDSGWVYYRTPSELLADIGGASKSYVDSAITQAINNAY